MCPAFSTFCLEAVDDLLVEDIPLTDDRVLLDEEEKSATVVVPDFQLSLAIGKEGQNVRLAAKLCGWKIDIKSHTQYFGDEEYEEYDDDYEEYDEYDDEAATLEDNITDDVVEFDDDDAEEIVEFDDDDAEEIVEFDDDSEVVEEASVEE